MNNQEFLAASLPYGLKCIDTFECIWTIHPYKDALDTLRDNEHLSFGNYIKENEQSPNTHKPIIHPLDSLVKECVQADYNNGKPFIPIVELLNIFNKNANSIYAPNSPSLEIDYYHNRQAEYFCAWYKVTEDVRMNILTLSSKFQYNYPFWTIKYLLEWHFWPNMPEGEEVVLVTDEFNPYK